MWPGLRPKHLGLRWEELELGMFIECEVLDHCEHGDDCNPDQMEVPGQDDYGPQPFRVRGQVKRISQEWFALEGSWEWLGFECRRLPVEHNEFSIVRGAISGPINLFDDG